MLYYNESGFPVSLAEEKNPFWRCTLSYEPASPDCFVLFGFLIKGVMGAIIAILIGVALLYYFEGFPPF